MNFSKDISLLPFNTFGINVSARFAKIMATKDDFIKFQQDFKKLRDEQFLVLGGGSNVLFRKNFDGYVLINRTQGITIEKQTDNDIWLKVASGENWHRFVMYCVEKGYGGIENLSLIPGTVGAAPVQNIGAYGVEVGQSIDRVEVLDMQNGNTMEIPGADCAFDYRSSIFKNRFPGQYIILSVVFHLSKQPKFHTSYGKITEELERMGVTTLSLPAICQAVINIRTSKLPDPTKVHNAGSFFKNPIISSESFDDLKSRFEQIPFYIVKEESFKIPAGWLIENCGWKGYREGAVGSYPTQALILVNYGGASGEEVYHFSEKIIDSVSLKFGIRLEREVNIL